MLALTAAIAAAFPGLAAATKAAPYNDQAFHPPTTAPWATSTNYTGPNNGTIVNSPLVPGKAFDRFIQIWLENTDYEDAAAHPHFQNLAKKGITLSAYHALTHPSQPNYMASAGGSYWGLADDDLYNIPQNMSTIIDLLEDKKISWSSYQESMPEDGYQGYTYTSADYLTGNGTYTYYARKHNPPVFYNSVSGYDELRLRMRNWNDFAVDFNASALPQWMFVTPNLVNDAHDTTTHFAGEWLKFWLEPLLKDPRFNDNRTLICLTFDETETYEIRNNVFTVLLGGAVPEELHGTTDDTFYTHYSLLTTVQANWGLKSLGFGDANKTMSNIFEPFAKQFGWTNVDVPADQQPYLNGTPVESGPLNGNEWYTWPAPQFPDYISPGGGKVFTRPGVDMSLTINKLEKHTLNLTAAGLQVPSAGYPPFYHDNTYENAPARLRVGQESASKVMERAAHNEL